MHKYDVKLNGRVAICEICPRWAPLVQHHVHHRRYSDQCIWICDSCHRRIHADPRWAYMNGYMARHNHMEVQQKKTYKKCDHKATYFIPQSNTFKCQFCDKELDDYELKKIGR